MYLDASHVSILYRRIEYIVLNVYIYVYNSYIDRHGFYFKNGYRTSSKFTFSSISVHPNVWLCAACMLVLVRSLCQQVSAASNDYDFRMNMCASICVTRKLFSSNLNLSFSLSRCLSCIHSKDKNVGKCFRFSIVVSWYVFNILQLHWLTYRILTTYSYSA